MSARCSVCARPDSIEVDLSLARGTPLRDVASRFDLSLSTTHRHRAHVLERLGRIASARQVVADGEFADGFGCRARETVQLDIDADLGGGSVSVSMPTPEGFAVFLPAMLRSFLTHRFDRALDVEAELREAGLDDLADLVALTISDFQRERAAHPGQAKVMMRGKDGWEPGWISFEEQRRRYGITRCAVA